MKLTLGGVLILLSFYFCYTGALSSPTVYSLEMSLSLAVDFFMCSFKKIEQILI